LRAAKKIVGNFSGVVNTRDNDFLAIGRSKRRSWRSRLRMRGKNRDEEKKENEEKRRTAHRELDAKSLEEETGRKGKKFAADSRNGTTRYGRLRKKLARFCDFLLTGFAQGLILRIQIRGTWKRQADQSRGERCGPTLAHEPARDHRKKRARSECSAQHVSAERDVRPRANHRHRQSMRILRSFFSAPAASTTPKSGFSYEITCSPLRCRGS
jgi:hypothetical protein